MSLGHGFGGTTGGTGTTDVIDTLDVRSPPNNQLTISTWIKRQGTSGGSFGSAISRGISSKFLRLSYDDTNTRWSFSGPFATTQPQWTWTGGGSTATGSWLHYYITADLNSVSNVPKLLVTGVPVTVTTTTAPVGAVTWDGGSWKLGNRDDGTRNFGGWIGPTYIWSGIKPLSWGYHLAHRGSVLLLPRPPDQLWWEPDFGLIERVNGRKATITGAKPQLGPGISTARRQPSKIYSIPARSAVTFTGTGAVDFTSSFALAGSALETFSATGAAGLTSSIALAGSGAETFSATAAADLTASIAFAGAGVEAFAATGSADLTSALGLAGAATQVFAATGSAAMAFADVGAGVQQFDSNGAASVGFTPSATGAQSFDATGNVPMAFALVGPSSLVFSSLGAASLSFTLDGSGSGVRGDGAIMIAMSVAGAGIMSIPVCRITVAPIKPTTTTVVPIQDTTITAKPIQDTTITVVPED